MSLAKIYHGCCWALLVLVFCSLLIGLPVAAFSQTPDVRQIFLDMKQSESGGQVSLDHLAALASFYQSVIAILVTVIGLLATLSFLTIRHISKTAAEDMAVDAARKVINDSREFEEDVVVRIDEIVKAAFDDFAAMKGNIEKLTKTVSSLDGRISDLEGGNSAAVEQRE